MRNETIGAASLLLVGTIGQSVWRSEDDGATWQRGKGDLFIESDVRALLSIGQDRILAGADDGVYLSSDAGRSWARLGGFPVGYQVWTLARTQRPHGSGGRLWAGTCPAALFYSDDGGDSWNEAPARWLRTCANGSIRVRITSFLSDGDRCWAGAEIDGAQESMDGGDTWTFCSEGLGSLDIHSLARVGSSLVAATNAGIFYRPEEGGAWSAMDTGRFQWQYCRSVVEDNGALIVGNGNGPPGSGGAIWGTTDLGKTWSQQTLSGPANSTIWQVVVTPDGAWAYSVLGQLFRRETDGVWRKLPHEFGEMRALCVPASTTRLKSAGSVPVMVAPSIGDSGASDQHRWTYAGMY